MNKESGKDVSILCLYRPYVLVSPFKPNITYIAESIPECFTGYCYVLKREIIKELIYCRSLKEYCEVWDFFYSYLLNDHLHPPDVPIEFCLHIVSLICTLILLIRWYSRWLF